MLSSSHVPARSYFCANMSGVSSSTYRDTSHIGSGLTLMASFLLAHLFEGPVSKYSPILWYQGGQGRQNSSIGYEEEGLRVAEAGMVVAEIVQGKSNAGRSGQHP